MLLFLMTIFYGNRASKIICFFFHGWTSSPTETLEGIRHLLDKNYLWIFPKAPIKGNQWFEYGDELYYHNNYDLDQLLLKYNLNYKSKKQILYSVEYIRDIILNNYNEHNEIYMFGSSQGATILFHYICAYEKKNKKLERCLVSQHGCILYRFDSYKHDIFEKV